MISIFSYLLNKIIIKKIGKIKVLLTDVDGVLTDCGMYYDKTGDIMKKFHARDGMGVTLLKKNGIPTIERHETFFFNSLFYLDIKIK